MRGSLLLFTLSIIFSVSRRAASSAVDNLHYVGCYDPIYALRQRYHHHLPSVTLTMCVQHCQALKTTYAAVEASDNLCYCGNDIAEESIQRNSSLCNNICPDDSLRSCGGYWLASVYKIREATTVDVDKVDFLIGLSVGVRRYHSSEVMKYETIMTTEEWAYSVDYHLAKNILFVHTKNQILKTTIEPIRGVLSNNTVVKTTLPKSEGFAVDWVHDRIYWADYRSDPTHPSIATFGLDGENEQKVITLTELSGKDLKRMEIDPYKGKLFWVADNMVMSVDTSGTDFNANVTRPEMTVRAIALDLRHRRLYFVANLNKTTSLYSVDYDGEDERVHFSVPQLNSVYGLSILGDKVFWVNYANIRDVVYEAPLNLTQPNDVKAITTIDRAVWHMRVVHPSLQRRPQLDPCQEKGCSHECLIIGVASARCSCHPGFRLLSDEVTCEEIDDGTDPVTSVSVALISLLLVLAVVVTSLAMMYLVDKHWSKLESKLFGIRYSKGVGVGSPEDDNVNLV